MTRSEIEKNASEADSKAPSSPDLVVSAIYRGILSGRIVPGQKLIEADLASSLNVSRGPIREALKRLHAEGVIENARHKGAYVKMLRRDEAFDFLEILTLLTGFIASKAAESVADADEGFEARNKTMLDVLRECLKMSGSEDMHYETNRRFYDALISLGGNSQIAGIMPVMRIQIFRMQGHTLSSRETKEQRVHEFADIAKHVLAGKPAKAQRAMARHMRSTKKRLKALPDEAFAKADTA